MTYKRKLNDDLDGFKDENQVAADANEIQPPPPKKGLFGDGVDSTSSGESNNDHDGEDSGYQGDDEGPEKEDDKATLEERIAIHRLDFGGEKVGKLERELVKNNFDCFAYAMNRAWAKHMSQPRSELIDPDNLWPGFNIEYISLVESIRGGKERNIITLHLEEMEWVDFIQSLDYINVERV